MEGNMTEKPHEEYHEMFDELVERKFYGELTIYFQDGKPEKSKVVEYITKTQAIERMKARRQRKVITVQKGGSDGKAIRVQAGS